MAHFYEYLEFSSDEDRENQLDVYVGIELSRKDNKERKHFDSDEQQQAVIVAQKIPSIFDIRNGKTELVLNEFPAFLKAKMEANPKQFDELKADFRMGKFGKEVEAELVEILTK